MFKNLKNRFTHSLALSALFICFVVFITNMLYTVYTLYDYYKENVEKIALQYTQNAKVRMDCIENAVQSYINMSMMKQSVYNNDLIKLNIQLAEMKYINLNISNASVISTRFTLSSNSVYNDEYYKALFHMDPYTYFNKNSYRPKWYLCAPSNENPNIDAAIIYVVPLESSSSIDYLVVNCSAANLVKDYNFAKNIFLNNFSISITDGQNSILLYAPPKHRFFNNNYVIENPLGTPSFTIAFKTNKLFMVHNEIIKCLVVNLLTALLFAFVYILISNLISKTIIARLNSIYTKIVQYRKSKQRLDKRG